MCSLDTNAANSSPVLCSSILFLEHVGRQLASQLLGITLDNIVLSLIKPCWKIKLWLRAFWWYCMIIFAHELANVKQAQKWAVVMRKLICAADLHTDCYNVQGAVVSPVCSCAWNQSCSTWSGLCPLCIKADCRNGLCQLWCSSVPCGWRKGKSTCKAAWFANLLDLLIS